MIAGINLYCAPPDEKGNELAKSARALGKQGIVNMGISVLTPLASLAAMGYAFTPYPQQINDAKLPLYLASTDALLKEFNTHFNELAAKAGGSENIMMLLQWIGKNGKLAMEFAEEVPELKPFAKLLTTLAPALSGIISEASDKGKFIDLIQRLEDANTAPFLALSLAASKHSLSLHGRSLSKLDSALTFAATALSTLAHIATNLFLVIVAGLGAIFSKQAQAFLMTRLSKLARNIQCFGIACAGTVKPALGSKYVYDKITELLPKGAPAFIQDFSELAKKDLEGTIRNGKALVEFAKRLMGEKKFPYSDKIIALAIAKMQESPHNVEKIMELLKLLPGVSDMMPKSLAGFAPQVLRFMNQHSIAVQKIVQLVSTGETIVDAVTKTHVEHPNLQKEITSMIPKIVKDSGLVVETALQYVATAPAIKAFLPKHIADDILPKIPELLLLHKTHPHIVQKALTKIV